MNYSILVRKNLSKISGRRTGMTPFALTSKIYRSYSYGLATVALKKGLGHRLS